MKTLYESLLDDFEKLEKVADPKAEIRKFIKDNYRIDLRGYDISETPNSDGYYVVDAPGKVWLFNPQSTKLTNDLFIWGKVNVFDCCNCKNLTSLKGAPTKVVERFNCSNCSSLTSLEGAPKEVKDFSCYGCSSLTSLEGAPTTVESFSCSYCDSLKSLKGAPKEVEKNFSCNDCKNLTSLKGCPTKVGYFNCKNCIKLKSLQYAPKQFHKEFEEFWEFNCRGCGGEFTKDDVLKVTPNIKSHHIRV